VTHPLQHQRTVLAWGGARRSSAARPRRGDPVHNATEAANILSYSPLDNVRRRAYPHMLATGGAPPAWACDRPRESHDGSWNAHANKLARRGQPGEHAPELRITCGAGRAASAVYNGVEACWEACMWHVKAGETLHL